MMSPATILPAALLFLIVAGGSPAAAQDPPRIVVDLEGSAVWQSRNDVRIPNEGGTRFSIADFIGAGPSAAGRVQVTWRIAGRHGVRGVWAPLDVTGTGMPETPILFAGRTFTLDAPIEATYQFTSQGATYRYRLFEGETWTWHVGGTAFVRDAKVALVQGAIAAEDTDVGFVPLGHVDAAARLGPRWTLTLDLDVAAAPQGRAIDFAGLVRYQLSERWAIGGGYRTIEGGADVARVYTFAWLNGLVASASLRF